MKDLGYKDFFGKTHSHDESLKDRVIGHIIHIIMEDKSVSEKSFRSVDEISNDVKSKFSEEIFQKCKTLYGDGKRVSYIAEIIYDKYFKEDIVGEKIVLNFSNFSSRVDKH